MESAFISIALDVLEAKYAASRELVPSARKLSSTILVAYEGVAKTIETHTEINAKYLIFIDILLF